MKPDTVAGRRRGRELEDALLTAAWDELVETGYSGLTFEAVAERAQTRRPVVYRRWPDRSALAIAAIRHHAQRNPVAIPDTGTLRGDLIALMREMSVKRQDVAAVISVQMAHFFSENNSSIAELRDELVQDRPVGLDIVLRRAVERGELDPAKLTPRISTLPADLLRHEFLTTLHPISEKAITEMIDQIFLPLVRS